MITVGVLGATGYMGGEVIRVLLNHPHAKIVWATSRTKGDIENYHPNLYCCLYGITNCRIVRKGA